MSPTPGSAALDKWCSSRTEAAAVEALRAHGCTVTQQSINRWRSGLVRPEESKWPAIREAFGIPLHAWLSDAVREQIRSSRDRVAGSEAA